MNHWFARERPVGGIAVGLTSVALLALAGLAACTPTAGKTDGTPSAAEPPSSARPGAAARSRRSAG